MRIVNINCTFNEGSTGKLIMDIANNLHEHEFYYCYEIGPKSDSKRYRVTNEFVHKFYYIWARLTGLKHSTGIIPTFKMLHWISKKSPDLVHIHCPYCNTIHVPMLISYLKRKHIPTVITNHSEYFYTGNCPHAYDCTKFQTGCGNCNYVFDYYRKYLFDRTAYEWNRMRLAFEGAHNICMVAPSKWVYDRMGISPICSEIDKKVILNGIDTSIFKYRESKRDNHGFPENYILHVTSSFSLSEDDSKGGRFVVELAKRLPDYSFVICGAYNIEESALPVNIILKGPVLDKNELSEYYSNAKLSLMTSRRETYGMTCAESLCCGTPVVGFKNGGSESIALEEYCDFVEYGDVDKLVYVIKEYQNHFIDKKILSKKAVTMYNVQRMINEYSQLYNDILKLKER